MSVSKSVKSLNISQRKSEYSNKKRKIFIVGSKGIPASYGGFETFVEYLVSKQKSDNIHYHVATLSNNNDRYEYNGAKCFNIAVPNIGPAKAVLYDILALRRFIRYCKERPWIQAPIFYVLACRIGPFIKYYKRQIEKLGGSLYVNPDGHEWKRAKWNLLIRQYWKLSERLMIQHADLVICDSKNIEAYIRSDYEKYKPKTTFIAYGADITKSKLKDDDVTLLEWYKGKDLKVKEYYLVVGRFVPENNYETMIREFMKSKTEKDFVLITNVSSKFLEDLKEKTGFNKDSRIKFVGTVYNQDLLKKIRENAYGYFHGHEVGGTNPSLLESLGSTDLNLLLDVSFNREVGEDGALYWSKKDGDLAKLIDKVDLLDVRIIDELGNKAKRRILKEYSWNHIINKYENLFLGDACDE